MREGKTRRNPSRDSQRITEANQRKTHERVQQYYGILDLLRTWESQDDDTQIRNHDYIIRLRAKLRNVKNYVMNRANPGADL